MVLRIGFDEFAATVKRLLPQPEAYVRGRTGGSVVTAADPSKNLIVVATSALDLQATRIALESEGVACFNGSWECDDPQEGEQPTPAFVAAVAYRSREAMPGLWVDAFPFMPNQADVLQSMYEEFVHNAEVREIGFDDFIEFAKPNVLILSPEDLESFLRRKENGC
jgi:hypothetical protein